MDITALHPGASNATTGTARRRDDGDRGFRGVMELVAHMSAATPREDVVRPAADAHEQSAESKVRDVEASSDDGDHDRADGDEPAVATSDAEAPRNRRTPQGPDQPPAGLAATVPATPAPDRPAALAASGEIAPVASADTDTSDLPPVPTAAPIPTPAGAPAPTGLPRKAAAPAAAPTTSASATPIPTTPMAPPLAAALPAGTATPAAATAPPAAPAIASAIAPAADRNTMPSTAAAVATPPATSAGQSVPDPTGTSPEPVVKDNGRDGPGIAKVTVEATPAIVRSQGVASAVLVQAHMAAAGDAGGQGTGTTSGTALHVGGSQPLFVGGSQPLFVGADGGNAQAGGQQGGQQNGGQQSGGHTSTGGFAFGAATIGQRGFGGDAARAQFQEILATRTARAPLQGSSGSGTSTAGAAGPLSSTYFTAGPGGPQSTLPTAMASRAEATAQGRPGANPGTVVGQVAVKLASTAADGGGRVTIRLNPEELGKVDVKLELGRDGLVRATISAEKPETLDLLQRDARGLEKALQEAGLKTDQGSLSFDLRGGNGQPSGHEGGAPSTAGAPPADEPSVATDTDTALAGEPDGLRADGSYDLVA